MSETVTAADTDFLTGGGETAALIRAFDWSATSLGPIEGWPQSLRTATALLLRSPVPMVLLWGEDGHMIYNDAYSAFAGGRHPHILGSKVREGWPEVADFNDNVMKVGLAGGTLQYKDQELTLHRHGRPEQVWMNLDYSPVPDESGRPAGVLAIVIETTERVAAERALRGSEELNRRILASSGDCIKVLDTDGKLEFMSEGGMGVMEVDDFGAIAGAWWPDFWPGEGHARAMEAVEEAKRGGTGRFQGFATTMKASPRWWDVVVTPINGADGRPEKLLSISRDITAAKTAEGAVRESEERFRNMADHAPVMMRVTDADGHCTYLNRAWFNFTGQDEAEALGFGWLDATHPDDRADTERAFLEANANRGALRIEYRLRGKDGRYRWAIDAASPRFGPDGEYLGYIGSVIDIDERREIEDALRERERRFREVFEKAGVGMIEIDSDWNILNANEVYCEITGRSEEKLEGANCLSFTHHEDVAVGERALRALATGTIDRTSFEKRYLRPDGSVIWVRSNLARVSGAENANRFLKIVEDITDVRRAREALRESEGRFREVFENAGVGMIEIDADWNILNSNPVYCEITGRVEEDLQGANCLSFTHPEDIAVGEQALRSLAAGEIDRISFEKRYLRPDGSHVWVRSNLSRVSGERSANRFLKIVEDITDVREAREALRQLNENLEQRVAEAIAEREQAEEALRQAQKMEAVGQLTGGIAHDFNNLLTIITGNVDMARRSLASGETSRAGRAMDNALKGAERAAALTQRLLAFSRRQPLAPRPINVDKLVTGMADLLHRALGETVQLETISNPALWLVEADPNQLESAILNLAVNARDAMPDGGKLTIETANARLDEDYSAAHAEVAPGAYVVIAITDTGHGMSRETVARVFDPFFTTKDVGKGTGLGLSMVYGFVKQSGGHVKIYSEEAQGTTVKIYLPRLISGEETEIEPADHSVDRAGRDHTILVVEDDDDVRAYTVEILRELGYRVLEAHDGPSALRLMERQETPIELLFTDVVMPAMSGRELAEEARRRQGDLKILYTSGYTRDAILHGGRLETGVAMIAKPFTYQALAQKIRDVLDAGKTGRVLVVEEDASARMFAVEALESAGYAIDEAANGAEALNRVRAAQGRYDAVVLDIRPDEKRGDALVLELRAMYADLPILLAAAEPVDELRTRFAADKCVEVIAKPYDADRLEAALKALGVSCARAG
jgi:PAS domain S-box-containing protein